VKVVQLVSKRGYGQDVKVWQQNDTPWKFGKLEKMNGYKKMVGFSIVVFLLEDDRIF